MRNVLLLSCALSALGGVIASAADAQSTTGASTTTGEQIETVVVTAEKRSERLIDVPTSISVMTAEDLAAKNINAVSDISTRMPNVEISGSSLYPAITIRGVTSEVSGTNSGFAPAAAVYVDDVYQGRDRATNLPMSGIQQIEVLRGPQGTLYGKNTIAGAINISTLRPGDDFIAFGDAQYGNLDYTQFTGTISGPIVDDTLAASLSGVYRNRDGYIHNEFDGQNLNYDRALGGRFRAIYTITPKLTFDFGADYLHENDSESYLTTDYSTLSLLPFPPYDTTPTFNPKTRDEALNSPEYGRRDVHGVSGRFDYDLSDMRLTSITATRGYQSGTGLDTDGTSLNIDHETYVNNANQFSQELRLTSTSPGPFQWIVGAFYYHERETNNFVLTVGDQFPGFLLGLPPLPAGYSDADESVSAIEENSIAGFLSGTYAITSDLKLAAGVRFTQDKKTFNFLQQEVTPVSPSVASDLLVAIPPRVESLTENEPTYDISLTYDFTQDQVGYAKFSRGYKAGGFNAFAITPPFNPKDSLAFRPEFLNNYEVGYKGSFWNGLISFNSAVFFDDYTDKQEQVENTVTLGIIVKNAARAQIYGAEFELDAVPIDGLTLSSTLGLLHGTYTSFPDAGTTNACNCFTGNDLAYAPRWEGSLAAEYDHSLDFWSGYSAFARVELTHQSSSYSDPNDTVAYESRPYSLLNGRVGIEADHWGLYLWGKNLTNTYHLSGGTFELLTVARAVNMPRTYGIELSLKN